MPPRLFKGALISGSARWEHKMFWDRCPLRPLKPQGQAGETLKDCLNFLTHYRLRNARRWWFGTATVALFVFLPGSCIDSFSGNNCIPFWVNLKFMKVKCMQFDVHDQAQLALIVFDSERLKLHSQLNVSEKAQWSTGDGRYFTSVEGKRILLISTTQPIKSIGPMLEVAQSDDYPIDALQQLLQETYPQFDVFVSENPPPAPALTYADKNVPTE